MTSVNAKQEALLDELLKDYTDPQDILGEHGLLKRLTKRVVERVLEAELCRRTPGRWTWWSRVTATGALRRSWWPSASDDWRASTTKS